MMRPANTRPRPAPASCDVRVAVELNNLVTTHAIPMYTQDYYVLGWLPRYVVEAICRSCDWRISDARVAFAQVNGNAPLSNWLLVDFSGRLPSGVSPMRDLVPFQPVSEAEYSETNRAARKSVRGSGRGAMQTGSRAPTSAVGPPDAIARIRQVPRRNRGNHITAFRDANASHATR